jgi:hypothetical protein
MPPAVEDDTEKRPRINISSPSGDFAAKHTLLARILSPELLETRGIQRVLPSERQPLTLSAYLQAFILWFSINLAAVNIALGMLAPVVFGLGFLDASLCAVFGSAIGSACVAYIATWGPKSGCRAMVGNPSLCMASGSQTSCHVANCYWHAHALQIFARYTMGWWPVKLIVILNIIVLLGYSMIDCVVAGQILSAVSPDGSMSIVVG